LLPGQHMLVRGVRLLTAIAGGLVVVAAAARMLRIEEFEDALEVLGVQFTKYRSAAHEKRGD
jgi:hypothetical protein